MGIKGYRRSWLCKQFTFRYRKKYREEIYHKGCLLVVGLRVILHFSSLNFFIFPKRKYTLKVCITFVVQQERILSY